MKRSQSTCDPHRIEEYLRGTLDLHRESQLEFHLSHCAACRIRIEQAAAETPAWDEASELLGDPRWRNEDSHAAVGISVLRDETHTAQIRSVLNSLAPTDDPEMLGRINGYEVSGVIGCGGMGAVLKGFDRSLNRVVAIKVMVPHLASSGAARHRFRREAQAAAAITHDNVIDIYGVAEADGLPYLVMPYARGPSLQKRIDDCGPLPLVEILRIGQQIAAGLAAAHAQGLVHRDIKPANILLNDGIERLVITDFGLARAVDDASLTKTGVIAGTPQYMSPEQARGEQVDHRSDLFSLGSVLYTCCTGRPPFRSNNPYGILRRITDNQPRPIREINPEVPDWLCRLITKLHAKDPDHRYASAADVDDLLQNCLAHMQTPNTRLPESLQSAPKGRTWPWFVAAACVVALGLFALSRLDPSAEQTHVEKDDVQQPAPVSATDSVQPTSASQENDETAWDDTFNPSPRDIHANSIQLENEIRNLFGSNDDD